MAEDRLTPRLAEALALLAQEPEQEWSPSQFAYAFWPGKRWGRGSGNYGLLPDASGRHGGRLLSRLHALGLVDFQWHEHNYTARISRRGLAAARGPRTPAPTEETP